MNVLGLMSGTSLDGLDICFCQFINEQPAQSKIIIAETIPYSDAWKLKLSEAFYKTSEEIKDLDEDYGKYLADQIQQFLNKHQLVPDLISSHGHTVFHRPEIGITKQIGNGKIIFDQTHIPVVFNFRQQDVQLGGQGAPLVPIGDALLFPQFDFCVNLGGFSNLSWQSEGHRMACDISVCNMLLNELAQNLELDYDKNGQHAELGQVIPELFNQWNEIPFYQENPPKSLGREWYLKNYYPIFIEPNKINDLLRTACEHISLQLCNFILKHKGDKRSLNILFTGGGTKNTFLMSLIQRKLSPISRITIPDELLIDFKEAYVFAYLGFLRYQNKINVLASVTGAAHDHSSGELITTYL